MALLIAGLVIWFVVLPAIAFLAGLSWQAAKPRATHTPDSPTAPEEGKR